MVPQGDNIAYNAAHNAHYEWLRNSQIETHAQDLRHAYTNFDRCRQMNDVQRMEAYRQRIWQLTQGTLGTEAYAMLWRNAYGYA
jgi:hypothetical protein